MLPPPTAPSSAKLFVRNPPLASRTSLCPALFGLVAEVPQSKSNCLPFSHADPSTYLDDGHSLVLNQQMLSFYSLVSTYVYASHGTYALSDPWRDLGTGNINQFVACQQMRLGNVFKCIYYVASKSRPTPCLYKARNLRVPLRKLCISLSYIDTSAYFPGICLGCTAFLKRSPQTPVLGS